jgi:aryl sulfotransferase
MKKNIVWLASYPKSGNTWCRIFLANFLNNSSESVDINHLEIGNIFSSRGIIENQTDYDISELSADECDELRAFAFEKLSDNSDTNIFIKTHDAYLPLADGCPMFPINSTKAAIYFIRNPFDLSLSFANHLSKNVESTINKMCDEKFMLAASIKKFNTQVRQKLLSWSGHVTSWTMQNDFPLLVVRYEDLYDNPNVEFKKILSFLNIEFTEDKIRIAMENSSFENLKKLEQEKGFKEKPNKCESFFKVGKKGYYREILKDENMRKLIHAHSEVLIKFGYLNTSGNILI